PPRRQIRTIDSFESLPSFPQASVGPCSSLRWRQRPVRAIARSRRGGRFGRPWAQSRGRQRTQSKTLRTCTMAEVALGANVIVAILYEANSQHQRAGELV